MSDLKEYIVTLKSYELLDQFYEDMESPGGNLYIPNRIVDVAERRPLSRNTHYMLSDQEAEMLRNDVRVESVTLHRKYFDDIVMEPFINLVEAKFDRSVFMSPSDINWGILRVYNGQQTLDWGPTPSNPNVGGTSRRLYADINIPLEGRNVDVVIVDGFVDPNHPEFALNADGTGGTRVVQFDWNLAYPSVRGQPYPGPYTYGPFPGASASLISNNNHGTHVAGTVAGNTQGWATKANIYNFYAYITAAESYFIFDMIKWWHRQKPINPVTGIRNPTIINNSWGWSSLPLYTNITSLNYRGTIYNGPFTREQLQTYGIRVNSTGSRANLAQLAFRVPDIDADLVDLQNEGITIVNAAGNSSQKFDVSTGQDYNNYAVASGTPYYYNRGSSPAAADDTICVGAASNYSLDQKAEFSNCGPGVDIFAPGMAIMSSYLTYNDGSGSVWDIRAQNQYFLVKFNGTSMASPQVTGVLACLLEKYPRMTHHEAKALLLQIAKSNQMTVTNGGPTDFFDLQGAPNLYLTWNDGRSNSGTTFPANNFKARPSSGVAFPRTRISRFGR